MSAIGRITAALFLASSTTCTFALDVPAVSEQQRQQEEHQQQYGADVSVPIHHLQVSTNYAYLPHNVDPVNNPTPDQYKNMPVQPLGDRQTFYDRYIQKWKQSFIDYEEDPSYVDDIEEDRVKSNIEQPQIVVNFTDTGYKKIRAPEPLRDLLFQFWDINRHREEEEEENDIINQFDNPTTMVNIGDRTLRGGGELLKKAVWDATRKAVEEWTGQALVGSSIYGIRVYKEGNVLMPHTDRLPLVCSAIINVAQDVAEPWPLEVYGRDGMAVNITMEPGDMILYESHSLIHGRPFALRGRYYANIFVHFEPAVSPKEGEIPSYIRQDVSPELFDLYYTQELEENDGGSENELFDDWDWDEDSEEWDWEEAHLAAHRGDTDILERLIRENKNVVNKRDEDGWTPLAYAARAGHTDAAILLVENGSAVDESVDEDGRTALWMATSKWGETHPVVKYLKRVGAEANVNSEL